MSFPRKSRFFSWVVHATRSVEQRMLNICNKRCLKSTLPFARQEWATRPSRRLRLPKVFASTEFGRFLGSNSSIHLQVDLRHVASLVPLGNRPKTGMAQTPTEKTLTATYDFAVPDLSRPLCVSTQPVPEIPDRVLATQTERLRRLGAAVAATKTDEH